MLKTAILTLFSSLLMAVTAQAKADLDMHPSYLNFGQVVVGRTADMKVRIKNTGHTAAYGVALKDVSRPFHILESDCEKELKKGDHCHVHVRFWPLEEDMFSAKFRVAWEDNQGDHHTSIILTGTGIAP